MEVLLQKLSFELEGKLLWDDLHKKVYATDASVYRKIPLAVAYPKNNKDLVVLVQFAKDNNVTLTLRTAGTSLAGQCVSDGLIVDVSKHFTKILKFDKNAKTVTVQPGVIRDDLNRYLKPNELFFGPNTSTANRCMIGGMVGNNSSGTTSIRYGVTRDKIISLKTILSDGSEAEFTTVGVDGFKAKSKRPTLEGQIYKFFLDEFAKEEVRVHIKENYPKEEIHRRNTGYAVDELLEFELFGGESPTINLGKLLCGSEGTLAITTEITLQLDDLPPKHNLMVAAHYSSIQECMESVVVAMKHKLYNCELMDKIILDCTKNNREQEKNRFFLEGDPEAILMLEVASNDIKETQTLAKNLISDLQSHNFGYAFPMIHADKIPNVHQLRAAGLGALGNIVGDDKAVACIEDTAVSLADLPSFIAEFTAMMKKYKQQAVYYAHAGAGEIHLRPILNLKKKEDVVLFRQITTDVAELVKKYKGSLSGEHGDGIVRAEFIPMMIGKENYQLLKKIKEVFDVQNILNRGKIVNALPMDESLRYEVERVEPQVNTIFDFSDSEGALKLVEKCNGSGDCRKSVEAGGVMCPSYRATKNEKDTTRARANVLREVLTNNTAQNKFNDEALKQAFDLCIGCKACASECPSNVDISTLKSEFLYQYQEANSYSLRSRIFAKNAVLNEKLKHFAGLVNTISNTLFTKKLLGIAHERTLPQLNKKTLRDWYKEHVKSLQVDKPLKTVYLFCDEFTNFYDVQIGIDTIKLLTSLKYKVNIINHKESGRSLISKGFLKEAQKIAEQNLIIFKDIISKTTPLVGIEPSAILSFRDEYPRLVDDSGNAKELAKNTFTIEEFITGEIEKNNITSEQFIDKNRDVKVHVHCHQKVLSTPKATFDMLNVIPNYKVTLMSTGCCGMAGSFGYEQEHYEVSMQMGENSIFPKVRNANEETLIVASGTSCRHQIKEGTERSSLHPVTVLKEALA